MRTHILTTWCLVFLLSAGLSACSEETAPSTPISRPHPPANSEPLDGEFSDYFECIWKCDSDKAYARAALEGDYQECTTAGYGTLHCWELFNQGLLDIEARYTACRQACEGSSSPPPCTDCHDMPSDHGEPIDLDDTPSEPTP